MNTKYLISEKNIIILALLLAGVFSCNTIVHRENIYELLIFQIYEWDIKKEEFYESTTKMNLIAREYDNNRILQQIYCDNMHYENNNFYILGQNILKDGLQKHKKSLKEPHNCFVSKMDFNHFIYRDFDVDLTKGSNYMFISNRLNPLWTMDSIPLNEFLAHSIILVEPDYMEKINDSICISHASRLLKREYYHPSENNEYDRYIKHSIIYDRDRQVIVASERRHAYTNKLLSKYELVKVIRLTQKEFYEFWTGEN